MKFQRIPRNFGTILHFGTMKIFLVAIPVQVPPVVRRSIFTFYLKQGPKTGSRSPPYFGVPNSLFGTRRDTCGKQPLLLTTRLASRPRDGRSRRPVRTDLRDNTPSILRLASFPTAPSEWSLLQPIAPVCDFEFWGQTREIP